jgi:hypothetical protein
VKAAISCAHATDRAVKQGPEYGSFIADTLSGLPASTAVLTYALPSTWGGSPPPVLARLSVGVVPLPPAQHGPPKRAAAAAVPAKKRKSKGGAKAEAAAAAGAAAVVAAEDAADSKGGDAAGAEAEGGASKAAAAAAATGPPVAVLATVQFSVPSELQLKTRGERRSAGQHGSALKSGWELLAPCGSRGHRPANLAAGTIPTCTMGQT